MIKNPKVIKELKRIADANGGLLMPEKVLEAARPKKSVLHSRFEWNDSKAAHEYRLWQARQMISVCVQLIPGVNDPVSVFCSLTPDRRRGGGYRTTVDVCSDEQMRRQLLQDALADLAVFEAKYATLKQLTVVFSAIRKVRRKVR